MDASWYCRIGEQEFGPLTMGQLQQCLASGQLVAASPVRNGFGPWIMAAQVPQLCPDGVTSTRRSGESSSLAPSGPARPPVARLITQGRQPPTVSGTEDSDRARSAEFGMYSAPQPTAARSKLTVNPRAYQRARQRRNLWWAAAMSVAVIAVGGILAAVQVARNQRRNRPAATVFNPGLTDEPSGTPQQIMRSVAHWAEARKSRRILTTEFQVEFVGAWVEPTGGENDSPQQPLVQIQLRVVGGRGSSVQFEGWDSGSQRAILSTDQGDICPRAPHRNSAEGSQNAANVLAPGQSLTENLAFVLPVGNYDQLNLALSQRAFGQGNEYFGFRIARSMIGSGRPSATESRTEIATAKAGQSSAPATSANRERPPTVADLNRQLSRLVKEDAAAREKDRMERAEQIRKDAGGDPSTEKDSQATIPPKQ